MSIVKKKKHVSKKNKKAWRKHCDIRDVEDYLEEQRLEERFGKGDIKPDSQLFFVDTGSTDQVEDVKPLSARLQKRAKLAQPPKCFETLIPSSKVQDPNAKRNHVNPVGFKPTALSKVTEKRKAAKGVYEKKIEVARKNRKMALESKRKRKQVRENFNKDMWDGDLPEAKGIPSTLCEEFISPEAQLHNVLPDQRLRAKPLPPKTVVTRAAVDTPHPGVSYNPSFQEHQELLQDVVRHETKMIKRESHLNRVTTGMFKKVTVAQKENQWRDEMSVGLPAAEDQAKASKEESESDDGEYRAVNPPVLNKKKDHKARRKQREMLVEKERLKREKVNKKKITDLYKLRKLQSSIVSSEKKQEAEKERRTSKRSAKEATAAPELNAHKVPLAEPDFVEPASLSGDLRNVRNATNLLKERYESLQRRGALAASKLMMKKKRKLKSYFKPGHKVTDKDVERYMNKAAGKK